MLAECMRTHYPRASSVALGGLGTLTIVSNGDFREKSMTGLPAQSYQRSS